MENIIEKIFLNLPRKIDRDLSGQFLSYDLNDLEREEFILVVKIKIPGFILIGYESVRGEFIHIEYTFPDGICYGESWALEDITDDKLIVAFSQTFGWIENFI